MFNRASGRRADLAGSCRSGTGAKIGHRVIHNYLSLNRRFLLASQKDSILAALRIRSKDESCTIRKLIEKQLVNKSPLLEYAADQAAGSLG